MQAKWNTWRIVELGNTFTSTIQAILKMDNASLIISLKESSMLNLGILGEEPKVRWC